MSADSPNLILLSQSAPFPSVEEAWSRKSIAPGLLAAGGDLSVQRLVNAYSHGIFPWFSEGQPILWWSPDPRMVLKPDQFSLHPSMRKTVRKFMRTDGCSIRFDSDFEHVMRACANAERRGQSGTWITEEMIQAYCNLHEQGLAHSIETWVDGTMVGGLYCVALGRAVFGESMFSHKSDASKLALCALVGFCLKNGVEMIDCQQNTSHLASLGAKEIQRTQFIQHLTVVSKEKTLDWHFDPLYWLAILAT